MYMLIQRCAKCGMLEPLINIIKKTLALESRLNSFDLNRFVQFDNL